MGSKLIQFCHRRRRPRIFCLNEMPFEFHDLNEIVNRRFNSQFLFALHQYIHSQYQWIFTLGLNEAYEWHCKTKWKHGIVYGPFYYILFFFQFEKKIFIYAVKIITYCTTITIWMMKRASKRLLFFFICCVRLSAAQLWFQLSRLVPHCVRYVTESDQYSIDEIRMKFHS